MGDEVKELAQRLLHTGFDSLNARDQRVISRIARRMHISRDTHADYDEALSFGPRLATEAARREGRPWASASWAFVVEPLGVGRCLASRRCRIHGPLECRGIRR